MLRNKGSAGYTSAFGENFIPNFKKDFNEKLKTFYDKHTNDSAPDFVKALYEDIPELKYMDMLKLQFKLTSINKSLRTIRSILVVWFIVSIIAAFVYITLI